MYVITARMDGRQALVLFDNNNNNNYDNVPIYSQ